MSSNSFGKLLTVTTFGESHGPGIGCIIDGCPPGLRLNEDDLTPDLRRRATGKTRHTSQRREADAVTIQSGVFEGVTTGTPIALLIENTDARSRDYTAIKQQYRPGHADFAYDAKYGLRDYRGGGRSSARETTMRVAAGAVARKYLSEQFGIKVQACVVQVGDTQAATIDWAEVENNAFFSPDPKWAADLEPYLDALRKSGDSAGARVNVRATGVPAGWGEPVYGKLDAELAGALMSINAVKGVEVGAGFSSVSQPGSEHRDVMTPDGFESNHAGGVLGGISTGQDVLASVAFKATSSLRLPVPSIDQQGKPVEVVTKGRHDPCVGLRAPPIVEAMTLLVLMDQHLRHRAQNAKVVPPWQFPRGSNS
ncbi:MAG: chorismate synthase [Lysobacterales bacterium]